MTLAIFDLDHTLLDGDGPELWFEFLIGKQMVDAEAHREAQARFSELYNAGKLDAHEWARYESGPQVALPPQQLKVLRREFSEQVLRSRIPRASHQLLQEHRRLGHLRVVMSATNRFLVEASTTLMDVDQVFATELVQLNGRYSGEIKGIPCFRDGKVAIIENWAAQWDHTLDDAWFYSDSINDLPLLERVANPTAVNPDPALAAIADRRGWPVRHHRVL